MATLKEQIVLLEEQLQLSQLADKAKHILVEYENIQSQLSKGDNNLRAMYAHYLILQDLPESAPKKMAFSEEIKETAKSALFALEFFTERWRIEGHEARQGNDLALVTEGLKSLASSCVAEVEQCWQGWLDSLQGLVSLEDLLLESQKNIPGLDATYNAFKKTQTQFRQLVTGFPQSVNTIEELQQLSATMVDLKGKMQFDLPAEVATFFEQLDSLNRRVSLAAMTPEVFEWLRSHDLLDAYVISRKGRF